MDTKTMNNYLKTIYVLHESKMKATTTNISKALGVKPASVTEMLVKLDDAGFVVYKPYKGANLSDKGKHLARKIIRKHRLLESFLKITLKLNDWDVRKQADELVHSLSDSADQRLCIFLMRPRKDPITHEGIPHCTKKISCEECLKSAKA